MTTKPLYYDTPSKILIYPSIIFMVLGMMFGVFIAFNGFVKPNYFQGEYVSFGRVRPVHVGHIAFLWLLSIGTGLVYYFTQRLCGVAIWSKKLALFTCVLWWISLIVGIYSYPFGTNFGWEYAEFPNSVGFLPVKLLFTLSWLLFSLNIFMTIAKRKYEKMYVSLWYTMGTLIWTTVTVVAGSWIVSYVPAGISRVNVSFFYVHNIVGLIFTPLGLAAAYYALPKLAGRPIYSHRLSMIGFWSIAFVYAWVGAHHIIHGPITQWLQTVSIIFSIWLFIPVFSVVANLFLTLKDDWELYVKSAPIRFLMMGNIFYLITSVQGSLMALRNVNEITSKTDWVIGHAHIALYGAFTFFAIAGIYQALPHLTQKPIWSKKLADWHFTLNMLGSVPFLFALSIGGFFQGLLWSTWADGTSYAQFHQNYANLPFLDTVAFMHPWWIARFIGGVIILFANLLFVVNVFNTVFLPMRKEGHLEPVAAER
jgi:cytochrome c oxidase cbb3-type subunit 1